MRNPYKKFQNSSMHVSKVMLCIKKLNEQTDERMNTPEAICPSNFFEVGGITKVIPILPDNYLFIMSYFLILSR